jgi:peroxiredoxin family protein
MDLLFICREATEDSVIGNVGMAMQAKASGRESAVLFTEEALAALAGQAFHWSPLFASRPARITISRNATALGLPVAAERDDRWTDLRRLLEAAREAGVRLLACPLWSQILSVDGRLPDTIERPATDEVLAAIESAKVVGGY